MSEDLIPPSKSDRDTWLASLAENKTKKALDRLRKKYTFLSNPSHSLYPIVEACELALKEGDQKAADLHLEHVQQGLENEQSTLAAAFDLFTPPGKNHLTAVEVKIMLEYLGFPSSDDDVKALISAVDTNGDAQLELDEFQEYVGRMGGSYKLFEMRRKAMIARHGSMSMGVSDPSLLAQDLKAAGIVEQEQAYWALVLPRAQEEFQETAKLRDCQKLAIRQIRTSAKNAHMDALPKLQKRVQEMSYTENDLWMTLAYIRELAPVIVHINLDKMMGFLEKDTHYRNQFETNSSGGLLKPEIRKKWEKDLFNCAYDSANGFDRPKYGVLNAMNDHRGVVACEQYGKSYMVLKDVRLRCTFAPEDSANLKASRLAVLDYYAHVLHEYSNDELRESIKVAKSSDAAILGDSSKVGKMKYKEAQLHGEICFATHVERLVAEPRHRQKDKERLESICRKHGWTLSWMDEEMERMKTEETSKLGEDAWKEKMQVIMEKGIPDVKGVPHGHCKKGCGRKVQPGTTSAGREFRTCCRGCALGFGHDLTCGNIDPDLVKPGMCVNGCGRPVNPGRMPTGKRFTTCCRGCARGTHDFSCGQSGPPKCKHGCGREVAKSTGKRTFDTCCRGCGVSNGKKHDASCKEPDDDD